MKSLELIYLAGGCFWCTEAIFGQIKGVHEVVPGYMGGTKSNPSYQEVCVGTTNHAEVVQISYDTRKTQLTDILFVFFNTHNPTTLNRQGNDIGTQYRSAIFFTSNQQKKVVDQVLKQLDEENIFEDPIVTQVTKASTFYSAEDKHHQYYQNNPQNSYCQFIIKPKLERLHEYFTAYIKKSVRQNLVK
ncbi:MAG: peptide-methionine (S)-S-oxide reductase MsrA [Flavobacteriaceae bacterium]|nr:peptide-methionine (S)-S-oxide reductase MsrA [Flavobacteriaceae bacterium]MCY4215421.1 peptide-methionine (S)-S-oxide reductase MsrA [Flavobacteriaceae bacterium]MCY4253900.1 peptide-methionine (S)-S-oxide reductase MsrA [Flavobacteriaceae bacterium]